MKTDPVATYRIQFRQGTTFETATDLVPYLRRLGISHLYASPIFTAVTGSAHGYDVVDHNEIDPALGGRAGFERLHTALSQAGMGLVLDIVPNHMAASLENRWWRSVVEFGSESPFAHHFDIDWSERLTLPILGRPLPEAFSAGEIALGADRKNGCLCLTYFDNQLPLAPASYAALADRIGASAIADIAELASGAAAGRFHDGMRALLASDEAMHLDAQLAEASRDTDFLERIHAMQPWRLGFWKEARRHLSYRRFFEVTGLVGVRVEDANVFDDVHRLALELVAEGKVDGLRVDHVDGLAKPGSYLRQLREAVGPDCWLLVEKIRASEEPLPADWPQCGTTGYEFIPAMADLLVDADGLDTMRIEYDRFAGGSTDIAVEEREAKLLMLRRNFEGELARLAGLAMPGSADASERGDFATALSEIIAGFEVYRTYGEDGALGPADLERLRHAAAIARRSGAASHPAIDRIVSLLEHPEQHPGTNAPLFRTRFQQLTGPVMAKAVEDTLFYRVNPLIALNEVGASPGAAAGDLTRFHEAMERFRVEPLGLAATATHDTKRGEDARARLYALTEAPERWSAAIRLWRGEASIPEPAIRWMIAQMVFGAWPAGGATDQAARQALVPRLVGAVEKALREAKLRTEWLDPDEAYEASVLAFLRDMLAPESEDLLRDFATILAPVVRAGEMNSLAQTLSKLTGPSVPDVYQGTERTDLSLVDPDNRRAVDFAAYAAALERAEDGAHGMLHLEHDSFKQCMIATVLRSRARHLSLFRFGRHVPLRVEGAAAAHHVAWLREHESEAALVVVPRHTLRREDQGLSAADAEVVLGQRRRSFRNVLTGQVIPAGDRVAIGELTGGLPVALCLTDLAD